MVWGLAAALAAGLLQDPRVLPVALFFLVRDALARGCGRSERLLALVAVGLFWSYGAISAAGLVERTNTFNAWLAANAGEATLDGWISSFPAHGFGRTSFEFTTAVDGVQLRVLVSAQDFVVGYGDSARIGTKPGTGRRSNAAYLRGRGCAGAVRALPGGVRTLAGRGGNPIVREVFAPLHEQIRRRATAGIGSRAGVPLALLLAERGFIDRRLRETFIVLGISHLLALSGLHLGFVAGALVLVLKWTRLRNRVALMAILTFYVATVGPVLSLQRALVMALILIAASDAHRPLCPMTSLADAFVLILLVRPHALFSVGFQLSFLATFSVLLCVQRLRRPERAGRLGRVWHFVRSTVWVSVVVQVFLAPVILHYFGRISLVAPFATVIFVLPVATLLLSSALATVAALVCLPAGTMLFALVDHLTEAFNASLVTAAGLAPIPAALPVPAFAMYYVGLALLWSSRRRAWLRIAGLALAAAAFFAGGATHNDF